MSSTFGQRITVAAEHSDSYVTAVIKVRAKTVTVITLDGEIIHDGPYQLERALR